MKITPEINLQYIVDNAKQASHLEESINSIPANVKVKEMNKFGDGPTLFVFAGNEEIIVRPRNCEIETVYFGDGVNAISNSNDLIVVEYQGIQYNFMNIEY